MLYRSSLTGIAAIMGGQVATTFSRSIRTRDLGSFVASETSIALQGALNNIGPNGSSVPGAGNYVVASPSLTAPNYYYTWSRDSALTLKMIIDEVIFGDTSLQPYIDQYITAQAILQTVSNPTGTMLPDGIGLGEPKYMIDGSRFNLAWGRPQRDGPALRSIALMSYSAHLISTTNSTSFAKDTIWPIIANDLAYVGQYWNESGFDLWEETNGSSFFTLQNQHRSLVQGAELASTLGVTCEACQSQQSQILCFLQTFWNGEFLMANLNVDNGRGGVDANTVLGPISVFDVEAGCEGNVFQPCESKSLANFKVFVDTFRGLYSINAGIANNSGVAVGRYPEDVYMGGNPWYLITLAAAEFLYDAVAQWNAAGCLTIDSTSLSFFTNIFPQATIQSYPASDSSFSAILTAATNYADSFVAIAQQYIPPAGHLAEQFSRFNGTPVSAIDLTWSYASFVTMSRRRGGFFPASWGADTAQSAAEVCEASSLTGTYTPALAAGAPNITVESTCQIPVSFNINATTYFGENIFLTGNTSELGSWDVGNSVLMSASGYPVWNIEVLMQAGEEGGVVGFVFGRLEDCGQGDVFESVNRTVVVPGCGGDAVTVESSWVGDVGSSGGC